ncbi:chain-length determining protein [Aquicoccus sp. SCR17]|nr:chain-length determining protein [Carideicomes alvinocaridis]
MSQIQSVPELLAMLRRRAFVIVFIALAGCIMSLWFALNLPREYEATAVIQIETPQVADGSPATSSTAASHRLQLIQQRLMARDRLASMIESHGLFPDRPDMSMSEKIYALRVATRIEEIREGVESWQPGGTPSGLRVSVRLGDPDQAAIMANEFVDALMEQNRARRETQATETLDFYSEEEAQVTAEISRVERELAEFKRANADALPAGLTQLRSQLSGLRDTVLEIDRQIISLDSETGRTRQSVADSQAAQLRQQKALVEDRIAELEAALASAPTVERQYNALTRQLDELQNQLSVVTRRRADAEMTQVLESRQQTERFEILETALPPTHSVSASRKKVALLGGALSVVAGLGAAFLLELFNPAIRSAAQLERVLGLSPVVSIPMVSTSMERRRRTLLWIGGLAVIFAGLPLLLRMVTDRFGMLKLLGGH